jgi:hypothetical protein
MHILSVRTASVHCADVCGLSLFTRLQASLPLSRHDGRCALPHPRRRCAVGALTACVLCALCVVCPSRLAGRQLSRYFGDAVDAAVCRGDRLYRCELVGGRRSISGRPEGLCGCGRLFAENDCGVCVANVAHALFAWADLKGERQYRLFRAAFIAAIAFVMFISTFKMVRIHLCSCSAVQCSSVRPVDRSLTCSAAFAADVVVLRARGCVLCRCAGGLAHGMGVRRSDHWPVRIPFGMGNSHSHRVGH